MNTQATAHRSFRCPGPIRRRAALQWGALGLGGLSLADCLRLKAQAGTASKPPETAVIFIWLPGGPPHMETYDMKPEAPADYRGEFRPISTTVPELQVCELLPRHAAIAHKYNIIRSISHEFADHGGGHKRFLTGRLPKTPTGFVNDAPAAPSIVAKMREHIDVGLPNYIAGVPRGDVDTFSFGAAYLGPAYTPFMVHGDPSSPKFEVKNLALDKRIGDRLLDRRRLLAQFDRLRRSVDTTGLMDAMDEFNQRAVSMLLSDRARRAFDLSDEPESLKARYGHHCWGYRALLARRLVEAGCSFVTMIMENPYQSGVPWLPNNEGVYNWDSHAVNCHIFKDLRVRLPIYDQAVTALIEDLFDRGLDKKVMLIVTGEFGRTPRINPQNGRPGRDHWPQAMSMLVTG
ncbi:MAG: DUF1501 domain-containing protein, partial [Planctomycetota bacterium]